VTPGVHIEFFFQQDCDNCSRVENEILPELEGLYGGFYAIDKCDTGIMTNYLRLAGYQERLGCKTDADVSMVVNGRVMLNGLSEIRNGLFETIDRTLAGDLGAVPATPATMDALQARMHQFILPGIMAAGFVDGLNPCAIATLVFFMSLLALLKISGRQLLLAGSAFCAASFLTYFAIGLGLLRALHMAAGFVVVRAAINLGMTALLFLFAGLSFRDAWRYRHDSDPKGLSLRLPRPILLMTHAMMRRGLQSRHLILGGIGIGAAVTALESICTGQVYVPTLVLVLRSGSSFLRATIYLALYNLLFILPLIIIFWLTWRGLKTAELLAWSRRNVVFSKCLLGFFFLGLATLLMAL
ncbi:MAG: hypothetical protein Q8O57_12910, partial [Kiritimatiellota bacterium]|nr:hypothetical protein [Kiritimatiellota bacterium]